MKKKHQKLYILTKTVHLVKKLTKSNDFPRRRGKSDFYISLRDLKRININDQFLLTPPQVLSYSEMKRLKML